MAKANKTRAILDDIAARAVAEAHHFSCTIFWDRRYVTRRFDSLIEARQHAPLLEAEASNHRKALVYAISPGGLTHLIPDSFRA
jgi:hypothetical protein